MPDKYRSSYVRSIYIDGEEIQIDKVTNVHDETDFWYDFFIDGTCINEGEPFWELPEENELLKILQEMIKK